MTTVLEIISWVLLGVQFAAVVVQIVCSVRARKNWIKSKELLGEIVNLHRDLTSEEN